MEEKLKILVIGDSCIDKFIYCNIDRICPEAPVPVFNPIKVKKNGGMAANIKANVQALGVDCDIITNDELITKTRYVDDKTNQMLLRVDENDCVNMSIDINKVKNKINKYAGVIIADYDKGFLDFKHLEAISKNHPLTFLDTKKIIGEWAYNFSFIKINQAEVSKLKEARPYMFMNPKTRECLFEALIITRGPRGCDHKKINYPVEKVEIRDFAGAGDTFLAGLVCKYLETKNMEEALGFANQCGTQVVQKKGVVCVQLPI